MMLLALEIRLRESRPRHDEKQVTYRISLARR